ncbi:polysaccharide pyruvyl transferase family protein [Aurantiacibacter gilvus]|uniref:Polysaccharide pyruvyl transferase family protein n=1 Tax=Aurantiacibacter gilvus TaxID=3139141 RepID=A0ABU9IGK6_9SPHN
MITALLLNDTRIDNHHGCTTVIETIDRLCAANGVEVVARVPAHADWRQDAAALEAFRQVDLVLVNGEGTIHHDRPAGRLLLEAGAHAAGLGKPAVLLNATWQANSAEALDLLRSFSIVSVRESASEAELVGHGFSPRRIPDLALFHEPQMAVRREGVRYCDSVQGGKAMALYRRMWKLGADPLPITRLDYHPMIVLRWLRRWSPRKTALLNPVHLALALRATWQDYTRQVAGRDDLTTRVAASELIVTGRFHMMIFALAASTPLLALASNTHKIGATMRDAGLEDWRQVDDIAAIDAALLEKASRWHGDEEARLRAFLEEGCSAMRTLFADVAQLAGQ